MGKRPGNGGEPVVGVTCGASEATLSAARDMRRTPTVAEAAAWELLRGRRLGGYKFRRQQPVCGFIVDFYCAELSLAIELDGAVHDSLEQSRYDAERDVLLAKRGVHVVRLANEAVSRERLLEAIQPFIPGE